MSWEMGGAAGRQDNKERGRQRADKIKTTTSEKALARMEMHREMRRDMQRHLAPSAGTSRQAESRRGQVPKPSANRERGREREREGEQDRSRRAQRHGNTAPTFQSFGR